MVKKASFWTYLKAAFAWRWNLLGVGAAVVFAFLSRQPDMILPLAGAVELAYLGLLTTNPRFRKSVDARGLTTEARANKNQQLQQILTSLIPPDKQRFESLRQRCLTLNELGKQFRGLGAGDVAAGLDDLHLSSLDRLLWMFLKLLHSKDALNRFLQNTKRETLEAEIKDTTKKLEAARADGKESLVRSLEDKLATMGDRLNNYDNAAENFELIQAELERIEQKVTAVSEMSMSSADPAILSSQVDGIADSISVTTEAVRKLDVLPEIEYDDAPSFLRQEE